MKCYYHKDYLGKEVETGDQQFCNEEEHELWADKTYGTKGNRNRGKSIEYMQQRLKEMGKERKYEQ